MIEDTDREIPAIHMTISSMFKDLNASDNIDSVIDSAVNFMYVIQIRVHHIISVDSHMCRKKVPPKRLERLTRKLNIRTGSLLKPSCRFNKIRADWVLKQILNKEVFCPSSQVTDEKEAFDVNALATNSKFASEYVKAFIASGLMKSPARKKGFEFKVILSNLKKFAHICLKHLKIIYIKLIFKANMNTH